MDVGAQATQKIECFLELNQPKTLSMSEVFEPEICTHSDACKHPSYQIHPYIEQLNPDVAHLPSPKTLEPTSNKAIILNSEDFPSWIYCERETRLFNIAQILTARERIMLGFFTRRGKAAKNWHSRAMLIDLRKTKLTIITREEKFLLSET